MTAAFCFCALISIFDNSMIIGRVVTEVRRYFHDVIVVDDGSSDSSCAVLDVFVQHSGARVVRCLCNGGKGVAVKIGFDVVRDLGYTYVLQIDADGQHDSQDIPRFLELVAVRFEAIVFGHPVWDESTLWGWRAAHAFTNFWTRVETAGLAIVDPQCGYRVYPVGPACDVAACGNRMSFDIEIAVRLVWAGVLVINLPICVRYFFVQGGGVSHFRSFCDNVAITWMHIRLVVELLLWRLGSWRRRREAR